MESCNETDNITTSILEEDIIKGIMSDRITSRNPKDYINTYLGMLQRKYTSIPPIEGEFLNYYYETARDADRQRLLIGKIVIKVVLDLEIQDKRHIIVF